MLATLVLLGDVLLDSKASAGGLVDNCQAGAGIHAADIPRGVIGWGGFLDMDASDWQTSWARGGSGDELLVRLQLTRAGPEAM